TLTYTSLLRTCSCELSINQGVHYPSRNYSPIIESTLDGTGVGFDIIDRTKHDCQPVGQNTDQDLEFCASGDFTQLGHKLRFIQLIWVSHPHGTTVSRLPAARCSSGTDLIGSITG